MTSLRVGSAFSRAFESQLGEIRADPVMRVYGACLALVNSVTAVFWLIVQPVDQILAPEMPICWPLLTNCHVWRILDATTIQLIVGFLFVAGILNAIVFLRPKLTSVAYWMLVTVTALKIAIVAQDYRLVLNQHYMALWVAFVYLFVPGKRLCLRVLLVSFYVWAALLKFTPEWISGAALYGQRPFGLPAEWIPAACIYVIVLELLITPFLLSKGRWIFWLAYAQVILFHFASFWVVGFFYPLLMFLLLAIFPLSHLTSLRPNEQFTDVRQHFEWRRSWSTITVITCFAVLQLLPRTLPGDRAITGEGRMWSLNMFDAPLECQASALVRLPAGGDRSVPLTVPFANPRIACDPLLFFEFAKAQCRLNKARGAFRDFDLRLETRRVGRPTFAPVVFVADFCSARVSYSMWRHNGWILAH